MQDFFDPRFPGQAGSPVEIEEQLIPIFAKVAVDDPSLAVRAQAVQGMNDLFSGSPNFPESGLDLLDLQELRKWWGQNKADYRALAWISRMRPGRSQYPSIDSAYLFDQLVNVKAISDVNQRAIQKAISQARSKAEKPYELPLDTLKNDVEGWNDCDFLEKDPNHQMDGRSNPSSSDEGIAKGVYEIAFLLKACKSPTDPVYLRKIADIGIQTHSLSKRYGAIALVNTWAGTHFDLFDPKEFQAWWAKQGR